jgi:hypothetical protein
VHQEDNLRNAGIYRLKLGEETLYFGDASLLRSLLKQQNQDIALYYAENKTPIPMNRKFKVFLIAPDKSAQVLESGKQSAGISIQGKTYTFEFGLFVAGQDDSTSKTVNITWPHYFFKIKRPGHEPEFPVNALAKYVYRLDINGQQVFVYAEPL